MTQLEILRGMVSRLIGECTDADLLDLVFKLLSLQAPG